jgi:ABC-type transport system involved in multi-copper enzyme maturation permease subunit
MNISPPANADEPSSLASTRSVVVMGRQSYVPVVLRLIGMELFKLRRRTLSKVIGSIAVALAIIPFVLVATGTLFTQNQPLDNFQPLCQPAGTGSLPPDKPFNCPVLSQAQLEQMRQLAVQNTSLPLRLPMSLNLAVQFALIVGTALLIIVIGTMVGGDYSIGTIRLLYSRGPTRTQFLVARLGALIFVAISGILLMVGLGVLAGQAFNLISGFPQTGDFFSAGWLGHALLYLLIALLHWSMYGVIALFFGVLGRSTVAAVIGAFSWLIGEPILGSVLTLVGSISHGPFGDFLKAIPDYFIITNFSALEQEQSTTLFGTSSSSLNTVHTIIVIAVFFGVFIGLAWWLNRQRDITN